MRMSNKFVDILIVYRSLRSTKNCSLLDVNKDFESRTTRK